MVINEKNKNDGKICNMLKSIWAYLVSGGRDPSLRIFSTKSQLLTFSINQIEVNFNCIFHFLCQSICLGFLKIMHNYHFRWRKIWHSKDTFLFVLLKNCNKINTRHQTNRTDACWSSVRTWQQEKIYYFPNFLKSEVRVTLNNWNCDKEGWISTLKTSIYLPSTTCFNVLLFKWRNNISCIFFFSFQPCLFPSCGIQSHMGCNLLGKDVLLLRDWAHWSSSQQGSKQHWLCWAKCHPPRNNMSKKKN